MDTKIFQSEYYKRIQFSKPDSGVVLLCCLFIIYRKRELRCKCRGSSFMEDFYVF